MWHHVNLSYYTTLYDHTSCNGWKTNIIKKILNSSHYLPCQHWERVIIFPLEVEVLLIMLDKGFMSLPTHLIKSATLTFLHAATKQINSLKHTPTSHQSLYSDASLGKSLMHSRSAFKFHFLVLVVTLLVWNLWSLSVWNYIRGS